MQAIAKAEERPLAALRLINNGVNNETIANDFERIAGFVSKEGGANAARSMIAMRSDWEKTFGDDCANAMEMLAACHAMTRSLNKMDSLALPEQVKSLVYQEFQDNVDRIRDEQWDHLSSCSDPTLRVMRCCWLQWIPVGIYYFAYSGIPRNNLVACPWKHKASLMHFLATRMKGFSPTIELHLPAQLQGRFSKSQSDDSHRLVAEVLAMQPAIRGISGSSWYCDPAALQISPHLSFVRELFEQNGGFLHRLGPTSDAARKALLKSNSRRRLYEEGKYQPTDYARYWARADILRWAGIEAT